LSHFDAFFDSFGDVSDVTGRSNTLFADAMVMYRGYSKNIWLQLLIVYSISNNKLSYRSQVTLSVT